MIESNSDHAQFKPAVNRTVICFGEWKQHPISADLDSYMNGCGSASGRDGRPCAPFFGECDGSGRGA